MGNYKLTIGILTWNGEKYLPALFDSLQKQTFQDFEIIVVDNASSDGSVRAVQSVISTRPAEAGQARNDRVVITQNPTNIGFAAGHNQIFALSQTSYYLALNQDVYLEPGCLDKLVQVLEHNPRLAVVGPRVMKWNFGDGPNSIVDSLGLQVYRNRRVVEIDAGEKFTGVSNDVQTVFGVSGAVVLARRQAIEAVGGLFDSTLNSYKEDVDLAYRLNAAGWEAAIDLGAIAYHDRTGFGSKNNDDLSASKNKLKQSPLVKYYSYHNHLIVLFKNEYWQNFIIDCPWILWYELKKFIYFLLCDRPVLKGLEDLWQCRIAIKTQRLNIKKLRRLSWREMRKRMYA